MDRRELLERYEATGDEEAFLLARALYEAVLSEAPDPQAVLEYGYLLECHGRNAIRRAAEQYERVIELDPGTDKAHYQLISARAGLQETDAAIAEYEGRLAASPREVREYRFLAAAYLAAHRYHQAAEVVDAGLDLVPQDRALVAYRGEAKAGMGDPEGALADWRLALELDGEDIGPLFSGAFLLEREGRLEEAAEAWRAIVEWHERRELTLEVQWPRRELERIRARAEGPMTGHGSRG